MNKPLIKARRLYKQERYETAMKAAREVLQSDRDNEEALFYLAHGLYYAKQYRRSLQYWKRLEQLNPTEDGLHLNIGACYEDLGKVKLAVQKYKKELELYPDCSNALYNLGALYYRSHKYRLALPYLERCYSRAEDSCVGKLARCYFKTGQPEKEQALYEIFLQTHPNDTWALNNLGSHHMERGKYYRALLRLQKAARLEPNNKLVAKNIRKTRRCLEKLKNS